MTGMGEWGSDLRDGSTATWSQPRTSKALDALYKAKTSKAENYRPKFRSKEDIASHAHVTENEKKVTAMCQKAPADRTEEEVKWVLP